MWEHEPDIIKDAHGVDTDEEVNMHACTYVCSMVPSCPHTVYPMHMPHGVAAAGSPPGPLVPCLLRFSERRLISSLDPFRAAGWHPIVQAGRVSTWSRCSWSLFRVSRRHFPPVSCLLSAYRNNPVAPLLYPPPTPPCAVCASPPFTPNVLLIVLSLLSSLSLADPSCATSCWATQRQPWDGSAG